MIQPKLIEREAFKVAGVFVRTCNQDEQNPNNAKIAGVWHDYMKKHGPAIGQLFGVYSNYESEHDGFYDYLVGSNAKETPEAQSIELPKAKYLVFENQGPMPQAVIETWQVIWQFFTQHPEYKRTYKADYEAYENGQFLSVHIGIH